MEENVRLYQLTECRVWKQACV